MQNFHVNWKRVSARSQFCIAVVRSRGLCCCRSRKISNALIVYIYTCIHYNTRTPRQNALRMSRARTFGCSSVSPPAYLKHYWNIGKNQNISVSGCLNLKTQVSKAELISNTPYTNKAFNFVSVDFCTTHLQLCTKGENNARSEKFARA